VFLTLFILIFASISIIVKSKTINTELSPNKNEILVYNYIEDLKNVKEENPNLPTITPTSFTENRGQLENEEVRFYTQNGGIWFTDDGVWFEVKEELSINSRESEVPLDPMESSKQSIPREYKRVILKQEFVGANRVKPVGKERLDWNSNLFYGCNSSKWRTHVPNYNEIYYENIYNGIDLRYYNNKNGLKYDFIVYPGANINQIKIRYRGGDGLEMDQQGNIIIKNSIKNMMDYDLLIYQNYDGTRHHIDGNFILYNEFEFGYEISGDYNFREVLIIDPKIRLEYSTFLGEYSGGYSITVDNNGNAIVTGITRSSTFPTTPGAFNNSYANWDDVFVTKFNYNGSELIFSTYIGGNNIDLVYDVVLDTDGNIFLTGGTRSIDYPTTPGAFNTSNQRYGYDVFVTKLNANGTKLVYSTYIIGTSGSMDNHEEGYGIAVDRYGNAFVTGYTSSSNFPITTSAYDSSYNGGRDVFVLKLNRTGASLDYSTYIGGSAHDQAMEVEIDIFGNTYVTGIAKSGFPTTPGAYDTSLNGKADVFVLKLNQNGSNLIFSTFIGGNEDEAGNDIVINKNGKIIITGFTNSLNFPTSNNAINRTYNGGPSDIFVAILNKTGSSLIYSTYLGGNNIDSNSKIKIDSKGELNIFGNTSSPDFPITDDAYDKIYNDTDAFLIKLSHNGSELLYSTYLGGDKKDWGRDICIDGNDNVYLTGYTSSFNFPITPNAFNTSYNGVGANVFVMKWFFYPEHQIKSVLLKENNTLVSKVYSKLCTYTFNVNLINTFSLSDTKTVRIALSPLKDNIQFQWDRSTGLFSKFNDPNNYVTLEQTSNVHNDSWSRWSIDFDVTFNWTYPNELLHDVQVYATADILSTTWLNISNMYNVENDLMFIGNLGVKGEDDRTINENELVRGGEKFQWSGLKVVYENTTDVYPLPNEYNVTLWDENGYVRYGSSVIGENFFVLAPISSITDIDGNTHILNISSIPSECDKTNQTFIIRIDGDNVSFSDPIPNNTTWQTTTMVTNGINITDHGGGEVIASSVKYNYSTDNGVTWSDWTGVSGLKTSMSIHPETIVFLKEGTDNLMKWQAEDTVGNGPVESEEYRIKIDTQPVSFSNNYPSEDSVSPLENVTVGITISDQTSGVNGSSVEFSIYNGEDKIWSLWQDIIGIENGNVIIVSVNITLPHGSENRIRWRAWDIAGNGPIVSKAYYIKVNTELQNALIPRVRLWNPPNGSEISSTSVYFEWRLENQEVGDVLFDLFLDTNYPLDKPNLENITETIIQINELVNGETYYWQVIPKIGSYIGKCVSGIWSFTVNISVPKPFVKLLSPENGSFIISIKPTLAWNVEYEGTEFLSFDVYLDTKPVPINFTPSHSFTQLIPTFDLEEGVKYYWKVVPWAGDISGSASEVWWFTIKEEVMIPRFELNLTLSNPIIEMSPGSIKQVRAIVTNLGEITDEIRLKLEIPPDSGLGAIVNDTGIQNAEPGHSIIFNITVTTAEKIKNDVVKLMVTAISGEAENYGKYIEERVELTIKIISQEKKDPDKSTIFAEFWNILLIIFILILIVVIAVIVKKHKDKTEKAEPQPEVAETVKPGTIPEAVISIGQMPPTPTIPQLPEPTAPIPSPQIAPSTTKVPTLASSTSTTPGQVPEPKQITQVDKVPQLPPVPVQQDQQQTPSITPVSEEMEPEEQQKQSIPTIATTQPETQTKTTNQITQQKD
jgi:hypothetical protein